MKSFVLALITLTILICLVTVNCILVSRSINELTTMAKAMPENVENASILHISQKWDKAEKIISLTVSHSETDEIEDVISQIGTHINDSNESAYHSKLTELICLLEKLANSESLSFHRIF